MNFKKLKITSICLFLTMLGCSDDYLIDKQYDGVTDEIVFNDPETASAVVTSVYDTFQGGPVEYLTKAVFYPANFLTQDFKNIGSDAFFQTFPSSINPPSRS